MIEKHVEIATKAGSMEAFVCHPERNGPFPGILFYMDAPGIREELRDMARRLATAGYCVVQPNLYYRAGPNTVFGPECLLEDTPERHRMRACHLSLRNDMLMDDTEAMLAYVDGETAIRKGRLGSVGYCMSGPFVFSAAGRYPDRFAAVASVYGVALVTDEPDSPHLLAGRVEAELYFAVAERDSFAPAPMIVALREALAVSGANHEVELYPSTEHGFAFPQRRSFDKQAGERHWERLFALFARRLR
jgi:carboxymethylenebutenolidase